MSEPDRARITIEQRDSEQDATFIATKYENYTCVTVDGPIPMVINQIVISPSDHNGDMNTDCGVSLNYKKTSKYHTHLGSHVVLKPEQESRLVEWLHTHGADFIIETDDFMNKSLLEAKIRGRCEQCGEYFDKDTEWKVTIHNEDDHDRHFCSTECFQKWGN